MSPTPRSDPEPAQRAAILVMAKMALVDGTFSNIEKTYLAAMAGTTSLDDLLAEARDVPLEDLCRQVDRYEDRFFIALRAYSMAYIDQHFEVEERQAFARLVEMLGIAEEDRRLIEATHAAAESEQPEEPPARLRELYEASSFAGVSSP